jgi:hypothetical protein
MLTERELGTGLTGLFALAERVLRISLTNVASSITPSNGCIYCGQPKDAHEPSGCCGDGGGSVFALGSPWDRLEAIMDKHRVRCEYGRQLLMSAVWDWAVASFDASGTEA